MPVESSVEAGWYLFRMRLPASLLTIAVLSLPAAAPAATPALSGSYKIVSATAVSTLTWQDYESAIPAVWSGFERGTFTLAKPQKTRALGGSLLLTVPLKGNVDTSYTVVGQTSTETCPQNYDAAQLGVDVGLTVMSVGSHKVRVGGGPDTSASKLSEYKRLYDVCSSPFFAELWHFSDSSASGYGWGHKVLPAALFKKKRFTFTLQGQRTNLDSLWSGSPGYGGSGTGTRVWTLRLTLTHSK